MSARVLAIVAVLLTSACGAFAVPGRACQKHEDCSGLKDGYCSRAEICTRECSDAVPCPENASCRPMGQRTVCLPTCTGDDGCFKGFSCTDGVCQLKAPLEPLPR
ncbi:MAG: hypothetical protein ACOZQL_41935 [Myxococcota bacterium]